MRGLARLASALAFAVLSTAGTSAAPQKPIAVYKAQAVDLNQPAGRTTGEVQMMVTRWSPGPERSQLRKALDQEGPAKLLEVLSKMKPVGLIRTPDGIEYTLRYSSQLTEFGTEHVVLVTDRPLEFWKSGNIAKTTDYPFSVVELRMRSNDGDGKLSLVSKITLNKITGNIELENYELSPVLLQHVQRDTP